MLNRRECGQSHTVFQKGKINTWDTHEYELTQVKRKKMGQIDKCEIGKIDLCLFVSGIPQPESSLYRSPALQGPNTTLANGTCWLSISSFWYHGAAFAIYSITVACTDVITSSLQTASLRAAENHYPTFADGKDRVEGTSEQL